MAPFYFEKLPVCLDIHGVCCDLVKGFLSYKEVNLKHWPKGEYDLEKVTGQSFMDLPFEFWLKLEPTAEFEAIWNLLKGHLVIATSVHYTTDAALGTYAWFLKHFTGVPFLPVEKKKKATQFDTRYTILIDDWEDEIEAWNGPKILIPRPWNSGIGDPVETVRRRLLEIKKDYA